MKTQLTVLIADDEARALSLLRNVIEPEGHRIIQAADGATTLRLAAAEHPDVILLDVMMPGMDGYETCRRIRSTPELATVPVLLLTALDDRQSRLSGLEAGADDFLTKPFDPAELRIRLRTISRLNRYRRLYEESSRYEAAIAHSEEGIVLAEFDGTILSRNAAFTRLLPPDHAPLRNIYDYFRPDDAQRLRPEPSLPHPRRAVELTLLHGRANPTTVEVTSGIVPWEHHRIAQFHIRDLTEKKNLEAQLLRSQRIELLGQLSGSVAHDLNNILTAVSGSATLIEMDPAHPDAPLYHANIRKAIQRGAELLRQLLDFARGSDSRPELISLDETAREVADLTKQSFGSVHPIVCTVAQSGLPMIRADATQIHQIVMNLCVNARDAMPDGGKIEISVARCTVTAEGLPVIGPGVKPGDYLGITVRDNGTGIPPEIRSRLFDPFFTTKPEGKGTGLGLATVLRIMQRHSGHISLETEVGKGTAITCLFPIAGAD